MCFKYIKTQTNLKNTKEKTFLTIVYKNLEYCGVKYYNNDDLINLTTKWQMLTIKQTYNIF